MQQLTVAARSRRPRALVLLGAGASHGVMPSTASLTCLVRAAITETKDARLPSAVRQWVTRREAPNFEDLIELMDMLADIIQSLHDPEFYAPYSLLAKIVEPLHTAAAVDAPLFLRRLATTLRTNVLTAVAKEDSASLTAAPINCIVRQLHKRFRLTIASLNYDTVLDHSEVPLDHGFSILAQKTLTYDPNQLDWRTFDPTFEQRWHMGRKVPYLPLHGSVHFGVGAGLTNARPLLPALEPVWMDQLDHARTTWTVTKRDSARDFSFDVRMVTGRTKWRHQTIFPYGAYYNVFRQAALESERWYIIGYGGQDRHIHRILVQAWRLRRHRRLPLTIFLVDCGHLKHLQDLVDRIFLYELDKPFLCAKRLQNGWYQAIPTRFDGSDRLCVWGQGIKKLTSRDPAGWLAG